MKPLKGHRGANFDLPLGFKPDHGAQSELNRKHFPEKMFHTLPQSPTGNPRILDV
jgi:hypothetical protein